MTYDFGYPCCSRPAEYEATIAQQQARIEALEGALERIAQHPGGTAKSVGLDWCPNEARAALAEHEEASP